MNLQQRLEQLPYQERSYSTGNVEFIHDQWIFFDEHDEPNALTDMTKDSFEIHLNGEWIKFEEYDNGMAYSDNQTHLIKQGDAFRVQKHLSFVYQEWLSELTDDTLIHFTNTLNSMSFSIYDCMYCHNTLFFMTGPQPIQGVNFLLFDNGDQICSVHHHFKRNDNQLDRFEITLNNGMRQLLTNTN